VLALSIKPGRASPKRALCRAILGPTRESDQRQPNEKKEVDDRNRPNPAADKFLQTLDCGINKVGKKNGEKEENQRAPRRIEKAEPHREQEGGKQNARRA